MTLDVIDLLVRCVGNENNDTDLLIPSASSRGKPMLLMLNFLFSRVLRLSMCCVGLLKDKQLDEG